MQMSVMSKEEKLFPVFTGKEPSQDFIDAFRSGSGSVVGECGFCGRICFEDDIGNDWEPGEWDRLQKGFKEHPEQFVPMSRVSFVDVLDKTSIEGCPCNGLARLEKMIWADRKRILRYVSARVKAIVEDAMTDESLVDQAKVDLDSEEKAKTKVACMNCRQFVPEISVNEQGFCLECVKKDKEMTAIWEEKKRQEDEKRREREEEVLPF